MGVAKEKKVEFPFFFTSTDWVHAGSPLRRGSHHYARVRDSQRGPLGFARDGQRLLHDNNTRDSRTGGVGEILRVDGRTCTGSIVPYSGEGGGGVGQRCGFFFSTVCACLL